MPLPVALLKFLPAIAEGVKQGLGRNTKIGQRVADLVGKKPEADIMADGVIDNNEIKHEELQYKMYVVKSTRNIVIGLLVFLGYHFFADTLIGLLDLILEYAPKILDLI